MEYERTDERVWSERSARSREHFLRQISARLPRERVTDEPIAFVLKLAEAGVIIGETRRRPQYALGNLVPCCFAALLNETRKVA